MGGVEPQLAELAAGYGIATDYVDWREQHAHPPAATVVAVLRALGVDASSPEACAAALAEHRLRPWRRLLPACVVTRAGQAATVDVHVPHGADVRVWLELEHGGSRDDIKQVDNWEPPREVDGRLVGQASFTLPTDLPLGYHRLRARSADTEATGTLIVTPAWLGLPDRMAQTTTWGLAAQLYSVRSGRSWGVGDLADLSDLLAWATSLGAGFVQVNPLHAAAPVTPMEPSPYLPTSRRFVNPIYLRVEQIPEYAYLADADRTGIEAIRARLQATTAAEDLIDRDAAWAAKQAALRTVYAVPRSGGRELAYQAYRRHAGPALDDFATWCVLAQQYGADWTQWPQPLRHPGTAEVAAYRAGHEPEVDFHRWLQWLLDEQLAVVQSDARRAGMAMGVLHDLAVGVHPRGADAWALADSLAAGVRVGAPPDAFNQLGQDWQQPPWRPDRLVAAAYRPFRELAAAIVRHAGGVRVDHIIGLFRLWWIPDGSGPADGTYVRYDHEAMIGILALEAYRAGAILVGEDLGVVEPTVRDYLVDVGVLGCSILWFEEDHAGQPIPPDRWREYCLASVTTHDLPPTAGYLAGEHVELRERLHLLTRPVAEELAADEAHRRRWLDTLRAHHLLPSGAEPGAAEPGEEETVAALHRYLTLTPARLLSVALTDAVGDRRTQNQPGTRDEYPNWRVPLTGPDGSPLPLDDVLRSERAARLAAVLRADG
ncbi:MAG TPA: 4-alpha-glucanotransferase [Mycobacteriales bacterium]|nr:4-alpha-glucanotransferase [Mycobacteriales bacterium]